MYVLIYAGTVPPQTRPTYTVRLQMTVPRSLSWQGLSASSPLFSELLASDVFEAFFSTVLQPLTPGPADHDLSMIFPCIGARRAPKQMLSWKQMLT